MFYLNPFEQPGQWYRGNTHTHSTVSDGRLSIADRFLGYRDEGYDFLVLTDHGKVSDVSMHTDDSFLAISGSELHPINPYGGDTYHFVAINIHNQIDVKGRHPNEVLAAVADQGGISVLCHPYWSGQTLLDLLPLHGYFAVEVFNTTCGGIGRAYSEIYWDNLLDKVGPVCGIACDDAHRVDDAYLGWIMVKSPNLSLESIMTALSTGAFYSTQGPEITGFCLVETETTNRDGEKVTAQQVQVKSSPAASITFKAQRSRGRHISAPVGEAITEASWTLSGHEKYVRVEIIALDGKKAWTQPMIFHSI